MKLRNYSACLVLAAATISANSLADDVLRQQSNAVFGVLPAAMPSAENDSPEQVALGEKLYMDTRLSLDNSQSCNSCHSLEKGAGGADHQPTSLGVKGERGGRNSPTVLNAGFQVSQFWDGRAANLKAQAKGPILNPIEMAMPSEEAVEKKLQATSDYPLLFEKAFGPSSLTYDNIAQAIAAFERTLITRDRFDDFLKGDDSALSEQELRGLKVFTEKGCTACHNGPLLGGKAYQKMGLAKAYKNQSDRGRKDLTGKAEDDMLFKTPMLRNIAETAPYFHDGSVATLPEAVRQMGELQLGVVLSDGEVADITAFLGSLSDKL
ncbi:cytochrome c peroxidase [Sinobacterium caligoides]|uniref:Cytochrome c peroxidase n=1 Tax=Sinobacterium caligoides TaxID=933926 RepID=A0A3N2DYH4_9GAMM|nr:cytochrome-c peroxidase [Sinobacterium caligoides]ROS04910.1 cytochrome c peroxidase [Sinobacterium caligoides]